MQRVSPAPPPARPDRNRLKLLVAGAAAVTAGFVAYTVFLGPDDGPDALNPIAQAAEQTAAQKGSRIEMTATISYPQSGVEMTMNGGGVANGETQRARIDLRGDVSGGPPALSDFSFSGISDGLTMYMSSPLYAGALPAGKSWIRLEPTEEMEDSSLSQVDPGQQLDSLRAVSDQVAIVGPERVRGVVTTHYQATLDYDRYADILRDEGADHAADQMEQAAEMIGDIPVDAWIDETQRLRRMDLNFSDPSGSMTMSMEMFDFGIEPDIKLPPESQVYDGSQIAESILQGA